MFTVYFPKIRFMNTEIEALPTANKPDENYTTGTARIVNHAWRQSEQDKDIFFPVNGQFHNPDNPNRVNCHTLNSAIEEGIVEIL